ncbi:MAG TPA: restriction endonuclease, partial [Bacteroidales bacterium]|nr:restriction endonuclease [Bacteroidales bacterium]
MKYTSINIQGNLISEEILKKIEDGSASGQQAKDFGLDSAQQLRGEIEYAWSKVKLEWKHFSDRMQSLPDSDPYGTSLARRWMINFFSALNFNLVQRKSSLPGNNNQYYFISHTCDSLDDLPVHIVGFTEPGAPDKNTLDIKTSGGTSRLSPHATMQEYLNVTEHLYGMVTNGLSLRLMRDSGRLIKLVFIEFDLRRMLDEDKYSEFTILFRLLHSTRFPITRQEAEQCILEKYFQESIESGNRIRDGLSMAVEESLICIGKGLLQHEKNNNLRQKLIDKVISPKDYYRQLLRLIYRLLFLMVTEERDLIYDPDDQSDEMAAKRKIYFDYYSISRLRRLCRLSYLYESQFDDLWQGLMSTFRLFDESGNGERLGIKPLAGELFSSSSISDIAECSMNNSMLLQAIRNLNEFEDENRNLVSVNYRALDVEELGSVYEGLLELH